ncbi:hypothetical protein EOM82_05285 [bacterium]|nr:hypothetical protein [bacterium]
MDNEKQTDEITTELITNNSEQQILKLLSDVLCKTNNLSEDFRTKCAEITDFFNINKESNELSALKLIGETFKNRINEIFYLLNMSKKAIEEIVWGNIFNNSIVNSEWFKDIPINPGRWAAGYPFLYVLYRVLNELKPKCILELGLGQSTIMTNKYAAYNNIIHEVVEHDNIWIEFFNKSYKLEPPSQLTVLKLRETTFFENELIATYDQFASSLINKEFDLIIIDAPFGNSNNTYSRVDILKLLPERLSKSFVIIMDDYNRKGEKNTVTKILNILKENKINYVTGQYAGQKMIYVIASKDMGFACSL